MATLDLKVLTEQLKLLIADPGAAASDEVRRQEVQHLARAAAVALEDPFETVQRLAYSVRSISFSQSAIMCLLYSIPLITEYAIFFIVLTGVMSNILRKDRWWDMVHATKSLLKMDY